MKSQQSHVVLKLGIFELCFLRFLNAIHFKNVNKTRVKTHSRTMVCCGFYLETCGLKLESESTILRRLVNESSYERRGVGKSQCPTRCQYTKRRPAKYVRYRSRTSWTGMHQRVCNDSNKMTSSSAAFRCIGTVVTETIHVRPEPEEYPPCPRPGEGGLTMLRGLMLRMNFFSSFLMFSKFL